MSPLPPPGRGRARIGVIVPVSNTNLEPDMGLMVPRGVSFHVARSGGYDVEAIPDETQMRAYSDSGIEAELDQLCPAAPDAILYGCTSATLAQGPAYDRAYRARIEARAGVPAITAASALAWGLERLGARRFAFTSPYVAALNDLAIGFLEAGGAACVGRADTEHPWDNREMGAATPETVIEMARRADRPHAEVLVISCTDFRALEAVETLERTLAKPVITSNQAMMVWALATLRLPVEGSILAAHALVQRAARPEAIADGNRRPGEPDRDLDHKGATA